MSVGRSLFAFVIVAVALTPALAADPTPAEIFARGQELLAKGDFDGALEAFKTAAQADSQNKVYFSEYALLRRVVKIQADFVAEKDAAALRTLGQALYAYYDEHLSYAAALAVAERLYASAADAPNAELLAGAQIALNQDAAALKLLAGLPADQTSPRLTVLHGLALAHTGKVDEAKPLAAKVTLPAECDARTYLEASRLYALVGQADKAIAALRSSLEGTPAEQIEAARAAAQACPDLKSIAAQPAFAEALKAESKVASGGCGKCPNKAAGKCSGEKKDDKEGCTEHKDKKP